MGVAKLKEDSEGNMAFHLEETMPRTSGLRSRGDFIEEDGVVWRRLTESLLLELNRNRLIQKSKDSDEYKGDKSKGKNRWERRNHSKIDRKVEQYNSVNMNDFFKKDILKIGINVHGETDDYVVTVRFNGALQALSQEIQRNRGKLEFKCVLIALQRTFNSGDVFVSCTCPDWKYRQSYQATKQGYNSGEPELRPANITNPGDSKGAGCKHVNLVIGNVDWVMKISSVINNYIHYMDEHQEYKRLYADVIYPALYKKKYEQPVQLALTDTGDNTLDDDSEEVKLSNRYGRTRGRFRRDERVNNQKNWKGPYLQQNEPTLSKHRTENNEGPKLQQGVNEN